MTFYDFAKHQKSFSKTRFWSIQKSYPKYLIEPVVYWCFWGPFRKMALKSIQKALRFPLKRACVSAKSKNLIKPIKDGWFCSLQKSCSKYLTKHVVYRSFWDTFRKRALKSIKKALGFPLKVDDVLRLCKTFKNH